MAPHCNFRDNHPLSSIHNVSTFVANHYLPRYIRRLFPRKNNLVDRPVASHRRIPNARFLPGARIKGRRQFGLPELVTISDRNKSGPQKNNVK